jgi:hypothetical protein
VSSRKRTQTVVDSDRILKTLGEAAALAAGLKGVAIGVAERPALRRVYTEAETSVFLLKLAAREDDAPPYDSSLEKSEREELVSKMVECLEGARRLASEDLVAALKQARVARDCAAAILHSVNLESRRARR